MVKRKVFKILSSCYRKDGTKKVGFWSLASAKNACEIMERTKHEKVFPYRCRLCLKFHVGHRKG